MNRVIAIVGLLFLCGCTTNTNYMVHSVNGVRGQVYTPLYDCGDWLRNPKEIGIIVAVEHDKPVSMFYGFQRYFGTLPPDDFDAKGINFRISPANYSGTDIKLKLVSIQNLSDNGAFIPVNKTFSIKPKCLEIIDLPPINISNFGTQIKLRINYEINGVSGTKDLCLKRRTKSELKKIGTSNQWGYPWQSSAKK